MAINRDPRQTTAYASNRYAPRPTAAQTFAQRASVAQLSFAESMLREIHDNDAIVAADGIARLVAGNDKILQADADAFLAAYPTIESEISAFMSRPYSRDAISTLIISRDRSRARLASLRRNAVKASHGPVAAPASDTGTIVPEGYYALDYKGILMFYRVVQGSGRWAGRTFVNRFRSDDETRVSRVESDTVLAALRTPELQESARARFASETVCCYMCAKRLTDETSRALGIGPTCRSK